MIRALDLIGEGVVTLVRKGGWFDQRIEAVWKFVTAKSSETK